MVRQPAIGTATADGSVDWSEDQTQKTVLQRQLSALAGKKVAIHATEHRSTRSQEANDYYWSVVVRMLAKEAEMPEDDFHDAMVAKFLPNERKRVEFFNQMTGERLPVEFDPRRSSKLSGGPFYDFVERVRLFGLEFLGVQTPDPNPEYWRERAPLQKAG